jgi:hypothetical protein
VTDAPTLFDAPPTRGASRKSDPATSRDAAKTVRLKDRKREVIESMTRLGGTVTASQIQHDLAAHGLIRESGSIRSRLSQLRENGLVQPVGVRRVPKPLGTGCDETTWRLM